MHIRSTFGRKNAKMISRITVSHMKKLAGFLTACCSSEKSFLPATSHIKKKLKSSKTLKHIKRVGTWTGTHGRVRGQTQGPDSGTRLRDQTQGPDSGTRLRAPGAQTRTHRNLVQAWRTTLALTVQMWTRSGPNRGQWAWKHVVASCTLSQTNPSAPPVSRASRGTCTALKGRISQ